ncbi:MAG TPA: hypothetical protein VJ647_06385 [Chitinophagaceae bacterium]|nr:hypothetical protein [Chitinophagaceae bacterium]
MKRILIICLGSLLTYPALAFKVVCGNNITISDPLYEDVYIAGANIIINAPIHGDLIIAGGTVTINDTVINDILVAGGEVTFNGYAGDDIRCAGGKLRILRNIAGDLVIAGGTITIDNAATVGGIIVNGGEVTVDGTATGDIKAGAGSFTFNGTAMKAIDCQGGAITINGTVQGPARLASNDEISIGRDARFNNTVRYWAPGRQVNFKQSLKGGNAIYDPLMKVNHNRWYFLGFASFIALLWYIAVILLVTMLTQYLFSATMKKAAETARTATLKSLGYGVLFWIGVPVCVLITFVTIIGIPLGIILLFNYIILLILSAIITSVLIANWFNNQFKAGWSYWHIIFASLGIFIVLKIITFTPLFGWLLMFVLASIAFGAIVLNINWRRKKIVIVQ